METEKNLTCLWSRAPRELCEWLSYAHAKKTKVNFKNRCQGKCYSQSSRVPFSLSNGKQMCSQQKSE